MFAKLSVFAAAALAAGSMAAPVESRGKSDSVCPDGSSIKLTVQGKPVTIGELVKNDATYHQCIYSANFGGQLVWAMTTSLPTPYYKGTDSVVRTLSRHAKEGLVTAGEFIADGQSMTSDSDIRYWVLRNPHTGFVPLEETAEWAQYVTNGHDQAACEQFIKAAYNAVGITAFNLGNENIYNAEDASLEYILFNADAPTATNIEDALPVFTQWDKWETVEDAIAKAGGSGSAKPPYWAQENTFAALNTADPISNICTM